MASNQKKEPARNLEEFIAKYGKKRFTPATVGKAYLLNFLYDAYYFNDIGTTRNSLWGFDALKKKITTAEDMSAFDAYYSLTEWLRIQYENIVTTKKGLLSALLTLSNTTRSIISGELVRGILRKDPATSDLDNDRNKVLAICLHSLTIEGYNPSSSQYKAIKSLREIIGEGLRDIEAYSAFLSAIAEYTNIPECTVLIGSLDRITAAHESLNAQLDMLRNNIASNREPEILSSTGDQLQSFNADENAEPVVKELLSRMAPFSPESLRETMQNFQPLEAAPPVPEENMQYLKDRIRQGFKQGTINWYVLYTKYSLDYRYNIPYVTHKRKRRAADD